MEDLLLPQDSLRKLLTLAVLPSPKLSEQIILGSPLSRRHMAELSSERVSRSISLHSRAFSEWTYEVKIGPSAPLKPIEVLRVFCPNTAIRSVLQLVGSPLEARLHTYNPRKTLDALALDFDPMRRRV